MIHYVDAAGDPRIAAYGEVGDHARLRASGLFVAEGRLVVRRIVGARRFEIVSVLVTRAALEDMRDVLDPAPWPVYATPRELMQQLTGYNFHRGCLALARRPGDITVDAILHERRVMVLEAVGNPDNVGGLFRVAAAFGAGGMLLSPGCADPYYRKALRTSMGAVLRVPFAVARSWPDDLGRLREAGMQVIALTPSAGATPLREFTDALAPGARLALLLGAEGSGLTPAALRVSDRQVRIPIAADVDSLNVVVAAGITLAALSG